MGRVLKMPVRGVRNSFFVESGLRQVNGKLLTQKICRKFFFSETVVGPNWGHITIPKKEGYLTVFEGKLNKSCYDLYR